MTTDVEKTVFTNDFSEEIWEQTYKFHTDSTVDDTFLREAKALASVEENPEYWTEEFLRILRNFKTVLGGRIISNAGTDLKGTGLLNCFVSGFRGDNQDSMSSIMDELKRQALILKSEGGYGFCADVIRPRGAYIEGIGVESPGTVKMLEMWDKISEVITSGSGQKKKIQKGKNKIRKGAMLCSLSVWNPAIEEFITVKQQPGKLTKFNLSVLVYDEFMECVKEHKPWNLEFPETSFEKYDSEWDGNLKKWKEKGYPVNIWKTYEDANELWDLIMQSNYTRAEPGILFVDTINKLNNLSYCEYISATNPCGEQVLGIDAACLLGSINLTQYLDLDNSDWDYAQLEKDIPIIVRMMDNVNDITELPSEEIRQQVLSKRRIGIGYMGYGSALFMLKKRYGSPEALELTDKLCKFVTNKAYQASALLAKEKGTFPLFDKDKYLESKFIQQALDSESIKLLTKYGARTSHNCSIQPTGNTSLLAQIVSGGLEPVFMPEYFRTVICPVPPEGLILPIVDWEKEIFEGENWEWKKEGDESLLLTVFEGTTYKFDRNRGLTKEVKVQDYGVRYLDEKGEWDSEADWAVDTSKLTVEEHINTMKTFARYIDSAMSKTINIPNNYPYEDFKNVYTDVWETGYIKGCTTYREGTMTVVLSKNSTNENGGKLKIVKNQAVKRPRVLECDIHKLTAIGKEWTVIVGLLENDPYEVFAFLSKNIEIPRSADKGSLTRIKSGHYNLELDNGVLIKDVSSLFESDEQEQITRLVSTSLRHGTDIEFIVTQLQKSNGSMVSFGKALARTLKKYLPEELKSFTCPSCNSKKMVIAEGCYKCLECGYSACS